MIGAGICFPRFFFVKGWIFFYFSLFSVEFEYNSYFCRVIE